MSSERVGKKEKIKRMEKGHKSTYDEDSFYDLRSCRFNIIIISPPLVRLIEKYTKHRCIQEEKDQIHFS